MRVSRRDFVHTFCAASIATLVPHPLDVAAARVRGTAPGSTFNGGATQVNPNFIADRGARTFADMMKNGGDITIGSVQAPPNTLDANGYPTNAVTWQKSVRLPLTTQKSGDYIMTWTGGGPNTVMRNPGGVFVSGSLNGANGTYRFTPTSSSAVDASITITVGVATTGASYSPITRLSVVNAGTDFTEWQADQNALSAEYLAALIAGKYGSFRSMNWTGSTFQGGNQAMWTDWASRKPVGYHNFSGGEYRANLWAGNPDNGGSGNDYTLTTPASPTYIFGNGAPVDKQLMHVAFNQDATFIGSSAVTFTGNTVNWAGHPFTGNEPIGLFKTNSNMPTGLWDGENYYVVGSSVVAGVSFQISRTPGGATISSFGTGASGNYGGVRLPTLNINGSGAVPIRKANSNPPGSGDIPLALSGGNPVYGTMVYDADLNSWIKNGASSNDGNQGLNNGVPPEVWLSVAIKTRSQPWFTSSAFALDPMTDFWPTYAAYVKANSPSWMVPFYEPVNELWNSAGAFWNTYYAWNKAWHHWGVQFGTHAWQGKTVSTLGQAINAVYGGLPDGTKYKLVNGMQADSAYNSAVLSVGQNNERMTAASYVAQAAPAQSGYTKSAASNWTTHVAPANYIRTDTYNKLSELQLAILYGATNITNSAARTANLNTYVSGLLLASTNGTGVFTSGSPGVVNWTAHGLSNGNTVIVYTFGSLFTGLTPRGLYYVSVVDADHFNLSLSNGGALVNFTGSQSGSHTVALTSLNDFDANKVAALSQAFATWAAGYTNNAGNPVGLTFYEGGWSPDLATAQNATTTVTAATNAANAVVTIGSNTTLPNGSSVSGVAAQVGGAVGFASVGGMTQLNTSTFSATFAGGGSANISGTNSLILNQGVSFLQTQGVDFRLPPEIIPGAPYYVVSTGNPFQISATRGGSPITIAGGSVGFGVVASPCWFVTNVAGQNITLDVDSSAFGAYTSGGTLTYDRSLQQLNQLRANGRLAPDLQGIVYGNTSPIPSVFASIAAAGGVFPSKFELSGVLEAWGALQPSIYDAYPTTGEWMAYKNFSPLYN